MTIERIYIGATPGAPLVECEQIRVVAGKGIEGDRNFGLHHEPGQNITLIEAEEIEAFISEHPRRHDLSITRRNLVTRGVRLTELIGLEFMVGAVRLRGVALCEPCLGLGNALATTDHPPALVVKRFMHRAGLNADVLSGGVVQRGAAVRVSPPR